ncbi:hypothetical protein PC123_g26923 [Phytophthora cactorum]|nr:hypothetical protein PC123_g26923 [Phytophthora cactorum]
MDRNDFPHLNDSPYESVRKLAGIFGMDALQSLVAATPAEQVERVNAFDTYERGLIAHVRGSMQPPMAEAKPSHQKPLRLKVNPYEGKKGENLHFWVREVELAMDAALISTEQLHVAFALSNLSGRAKSWAYTREATTPGCFASWAQLCEQLRAAFLPANYEYRQRSRSSRVNKESVSCTNTPKGCGSSLHPLWENPLHEQIKVTVFMDGLRVGPARTQLFRVQISTLEEAIQVALQEEYSHRQARTPASAWLGGFTPSANRTAPPWTCPHGTRARRAAGHPLLRLRKAGPYETGLPRRRTAQAVSSQASRSQGTLAEAATPRPGERRRPVGAGRPTGEDLSLHERCAGGAHHGDLAPESLCTLESEKGSGGLLVVHARVRGYELPFRVLIDFGASKNFARRQTVASNSNKLTDALRESKGKGTVSEQLADGKVITVPRIHMDLAVKFEDFDSSEQFTVLEMDKYALILGMPWLEKHEPWIDWRGKAIGASPPCSIRQSIVVDVLDDSTEVVAAGAAPDRARQPCAGSPRSRPESRPVDEASKVAAPGSACQVGNQGPQMVAQTLTEEETRNALPVWVTVFHTEP